MAMSMMNSGRLRRGRITASMCAFVRIGAAAPVAVMTMSLAPSAASSSSHGAALAPPIASAVRAACAIVRLTIVTCWTPCDFMCSAVSLPISPAPTTRTRPALEVAEDLPRERDGREADRHGARAEAGFRAHALADGERRVEQPVEHRADRLRARWRAVCASFTCPRICGSPTTSESRPAATRNRWRADVEVGDDRTRAARASLRSTPWNSPTNAARSARAASTIVARGVDLGAVARREHDRFARRPARGQRPQRRLDAARLEVDPLAQLDRRGPMTESQRDMQVHRFRCRSEASDPQS